MQFLFNLSPLIFELYFFDISLSDFVFNLTSVALHQFLSIFLPSKTYYQWLKMRFEHLNFNKKYQQDHIFS
jgi:hypothetical protein